MTKLLMTKLEVSTHSGEVDILEVENYNADELESRLNDHEIHAIKIGSNIYSRIDVKNIKVIELE